MELVFCPSVRSLPSRRDDQPLQLPVQVRRASKHTTSVLTIRCEAIAVQCNVSCNLSELHVCRSGVLFIDRGVAEEPRCDFFKQTVSVHQPPLHLHVPLQHRCQYRSVLACAFSIICSSLSSCRYIRQLINMMFHKLHSAPEMKLKTPQSRDQKRGYRKVCSALRFQQTVP